MCKINNSNVLFHRYHLPAKQGGEVLPDYPKCHMLELSADDEDNAVRMREHLGFARSGPVGNLVEAMENTGILIYLCEVDDDKFSGMNGSVNGRPYIVVNKMMTDERNRSTIAHELAHLMFKWPEELSDNDKKEVERKAASIAGAFLFPAADARRELGVRRKSISKDMILTCQEYGVSMMLLVKRAEIAGIITKYVARDFFVKASQAGWKKNEPSRIISPEEPILFKQLVYRAVSEGAISIQKGAELLQNSYANVEKSCFSLLFTEEKCDPFFSEENIRYLEEKMEDYKAGRLKVSEHRLIDN